MEKMLVNYSDSEFKEMIGEVILNKMLELGIKKDHRDRFITREEASNLLGISMVALSNRTTKGYYITRRNGKRITYSMNSILEQMLPDQIQRALSKGLITDSDLKLS